jgi:hypothetical protein
LPAFYKRELVKVCGIPPFRQRADEWMGHGAWFLVSDSKDIPLGLKPAPILLLRGTTKQAAEKGPNPKQTPD